MNKTILILPACLCLLVSCANFQRGSSAKISKSPHVLEVEQKMRDREQARQNKQDRQMVLAEKRKQEMHHSPIMRSAASSVRISAHPQQKNVVVAPATGKSDDLKISDRELYSELVASYDRNDLFGFHSRLQMFQSRFAHSPLMEDALYLGGLMSVSEKNYGVALKNFNRILKEHPHGHKVAAALFAKGATLKKMNLPQQARQSWTQVERRFPGSPESLRAGAELKILTR